MSIAVQILNNFYVISLQEKRRRLYQDSRHRPSLAPKGSSKFKSYMEKYRVILSI